MQNQFARELRRNATEAERRLWYALRGRRLGGYKFRRQYPVGPFITDFACFSARLVVELDGGQHAECAADAVRTQLLQDRGWQVVRFWNNEVMGDIERVIEVLLGLLRERAAGPHPPG